MFFGAFESDNKGHIFNKANQLFKCAQENFLLPIYDYLKENLTSCIDDH